MKKINFQSILTLAFALIGCCCTWKVSTDKSSARDAKLAEACQSNKGFGFWDEWCGLTRQNKTGKAV
jgi:hypothetical protein